MAARKNPFDAACLAALAYRFPKGADWDSLLARLEKSSWCGAIVGAQGTGKSTLLAQLGERLAQRGLTPQTVRLTSESTNAEKDAILPLIRSLDPEDVLLLDGADQLNTRRWLPIRTAVNAIAGCIVTVQQTSRLPTVFETQTTPRLFEELVTELTGSRLPAGEAYTIHSRHRGNFAACFRELRERWAG